MASSTWLRSSLALFALFIAVLCITGTHADMDATEAMYIGLMATVYPELAQLNPNPWTTANIQSCTGQGLTCNANGLVTSIILSGLKFTSVFPDYLSHFNALETVSIDAPFTGDVPSNYPASLTTLSLKTALFMGTFPTNTFNLRNLALGFDPINTNPASIPTTLANIGTSIELYNAYFATFPTAFGGLQTVTLWNTRFDPLVTGIPTAVWSAYNIRNFNFSTTQPGFGTQDTFPSDLRTMNSLTSLAIRGYSATGSLPVYFPFSLRTLSLTNMPQLASTIPTGICNILETLELINIPSIVGNFPSLIATIPLRVLRLSDLPISGTIPNDIFSFMNIQEVSVTKCSGLGGSLPADRSSSSVKIVDISNNFRIAGTVPAYTLPALTSLTLDGNGVTEISSAFTTLPTGLTKLSISNNAGLTGTIPQLRFSGGSGQSLSLKNNALTGSIPLSLNNVIFYSLFDFSGNALDLCANAGSSAQSELSQTLNYAEVTCNLTTVGYPELECPTVWSSDCFYYAPIAPPTAPVAVPQDAPIAPVFVPIDVPISMPVDAPTSTPIDIPTAAPTSVPTATPFAPTPTPAFEPTGAASTNLPEFGFFIAMAFVAVFTL